MKLNGFGVLPFKRSSIRIVAVLPVLLPRRRSNMTMITYYTKEKCTLILIKV